MHSKFSLSRGSAALIALASGVAFFRSRFPSWPKADNARHCGNYRDDRVRHDESEAFINRQLRSIHDVLRASICI